MNEKKKSFGYYFLSLLPLIGSLVLQVVVGIAASIVGGVLLAARGASSEELVNLATDPDFLLRTVTAAHIIQVILCLILYPAIFKARPVRPEKPFKVTTTLPGIFFLSVALSFVLSLCVFGAEFLFPEVLKAYAETMELTGLTKINLLSTIATLFLAPIGEEILFRGMTIRILRKATDKFFIINIIQALCFGIAHGNIVQGAYAFILGLVLGALVNKYNNIYVSIFAHFGFNLAGTYFFSWLTSGTSETELNTASVLLLAAVAVCCGVVSYLFLRKDKLDTVGENLAV